MFALCKPKIRESTPRGTPRNFGPKWPPHVGDIRSQIAAEWLQIAQRWQWRAYRKPPSLFRMVPSLNPYDLPFLQNGGSICPNLREWPYLRNGWSDTLHVWLKGRVFRVRGSNGAISGYIKSKMAGGRHLGKFRMAISPQWLIRSTYIARIARSSLR